MSKTRLIVLGASLTLLSTQPARAGEFDRLEGGALAALSKDPAATRREGLTLAEIGSLPAGLGDTRSAFFIVRTGQGNYTRVLASPALRKAPEGVGEPDVVLVLERFDTFEPGKSGSRLARGVGLILFPGFRIDLDAAQVVPDGQGGDLEFRAEGDAPPTLKALGKAEIYTLPGPVAPVAPSPGPSPGKAVLPGDFSGRFRLQADGRWSGLLELQVAPDRQVTGRFRSEANGTSYPVTGQVSAETPQKVQFAITFPQTRQDYDAFLWTEGKNVLAGSFTMLDRTFGFFAVREGAKVSPTD